MTRPRPGDVVMVEWPGGFEDPYEDWPTDMDLGVVRVVRENDVCLEILPHVGVDVPLEFCVVLQRGDR